MALLVGASAAPAAFAQDSGGDQGRGEKPDSRVGRLFIDFDTKLGRQSCSASVVHAQNKSVIATAAHCLFPEGGRGPKAERIEFAPGYDNGKAPLGYWRTDKITDFHNPYKVDGRWVQEAKTEGDIAFVVLPKKDGKTVEDAVGAYKADFKPDTVPLAGRNVAVHGYPGLHPYDGEKVVTAKGTTTAFEDVAYALSSNFSKGSSGGPWIDTDRGTLVGVTSRKETGSFIVGAPFVGSTAALLAKAEQIAVR
ncbi:trypsin-like serine peptidase [Streptomyces solincola]|uniref:trypsin-like serine peptidase n=1 Tax=Streptomyces solincola TaxID=2100817 RepID=UPI0015E30B76|nr:trypsin-like peptidase domain-containing protein [Streptomyces solincola]